MSGGESADKDEEFKSHSEIVDRFVSMRDGVEALWNKINELRNEVSEHQQVIKALEPMDSDRKCYRLIGDILVERTVGDVIPAVKQNEQGLQAALAKLMEQLEKEREALANFQKKYKIRVKGEGDESHEAKRGGGGDQGASQGGTTQVVLVSTS